MKIGILRTIAHNIADSLGSGFSPLAGVFYIDVFGEARRSPGRLISIDFLSGKATRGIVSPALASAIVKYRNALPTLCGKHGASIKDFKILSARYSTGMLGHRLVVTVQHRDGRCYVDEYVGTPARRIKVTDQMGRIRTKRGKLRNLKVVARRKG
jgi:hypothetical protein